MRALFEKGVQRDLILREKKHLNLTWRDFSRKLGIKPGKLHAYYYEETLLPSEIFEKFVLKESYRNKILELRKEGWGRILGGKNSNGNTKAINLPETSLELAEFFGIMLGDGNLTKLKGYKLGTYEARIVGDSRNDKDYLFSYVKPLIERLFKVEVKVFKQKQRNAMVLVVQGRRLVDFLESKGFVPGDKLKNNLIIPAWIVSNKKFLRVCLRGLYDTDGTVYKLTNQNSHQIVFTNYNIHLLNQVRDSLISFGINPSRISRNRDVMITKKSELKRFLKEVGFRNFKHLKKVKMWNLAL